MTRLVAPALVLLLLLTPLSACTTDPPAVARPGGSAVVERAGRSPVAVLQEWDRRRAQAWAAGDQEALRSLYVRGSRAGKRDVAMLGRWERRGLRVEDIAVQVLRGRVVARAPGRLTVEVHERLAHATASAGSRRWALPAAAESARRVTLWRVGGEWRVAAVTRVGDVERSVGRGEP